MKSSEGTSFSLAVTSNKPYWAASIPTTTCSGPVIMTLAFRLHTDHPIGAGRYRDWGWWFVRSIWTRSGRGGSSCQGSCNRGILIGLLQCSQHSVVEISCCPSVPPPAIIHWDGTEGDVDGLHRWQDDSFILGCSADPGANLPVMHLLDVPHASNKGQCCFSSGSQRPGSSKSKLTRYNKIK